VDEQLLKGDTKGEEEREKEGINPLGQSTNNDDEFDAWLKSL
jgi:hypothetical protein